MTMQPGQSNFEDMKVKEIVTVLNTALAELRKRGWTVECGREGISAYILGEFTGEATVIR